MPFGIQDIHAGVVNIAQGLVDTNPAERCQMRAWWASQMKLLYIGDWTELKIPIDYERSFHTYPTGCYMWAPTLICLNLQVELLPERVT